MLLHQMHRPKKQIIKKNELVNARSNSKGLFLVALTLYDLTGNYKVIFN